MFTKKAELGISTLILTAAIILVSAVIFMAFTGTANFVNSEARTAGMAARENIGSAMNVVSLYAEDGSTGNAVDYFYYEIKPPYASDEIKLNGTLLMVAMNNISREYTYDNTINCTIKNVSNENSTYNDSNDNHFGVEYVDGSSTYTDTIVAGELIRLCFKAPRTVQKDDKLIINYMSQRGYGARIQTTYTKLIRQKTIFLVP